MNQLLQAAWVDNYNHELIRRVGRVVDLAIFPFRSGQVQTYTWYDIDYNRYDIKVTVELFPEYVFAFPINYPKLLADPDIYMESFFEGLFKHFRYRPSLPVEDHIVLGED